MTLAQPSGWQLYRLGQIFDERRQKASDKDFEALSVTMQGIVTQLESAAKTDDGDNRKLVLKGDYVINSRSDRKGSGGISPLDGTVSLISIVLSPRNGIVPTFAHHLLRSAAFQEEFYRWGHGIVADLWTTRYSDMKNIRVFLPDFSTQKRIAAFLDHETERIDALIAKKVRLLNVLRENLLSSLERLTTPETPSHTELIPFRWVCRIAEGQVDPAAPEWADKPLIAPNHIESNTGRLLGIESAEDQGAISGKYVFPAGTVIYSKIRPNLAKACISPVEGMCSADMYPVLPDHRLRPHFLLMQLLSAKFTDWATLESMRVAMPKINRETLGSYRLWVPSIEIQESAADQFFRDQARNEALTDKVEASIQRLREYRAALITAAVTGQIDVDTYGKAGATSAALDQIEERAQA
jgi:type I restriction enzyme S subunit